VYALDVYFLIILTHRTHEKKTVRELREFPPRNLVLFAKISVIRGPFSSFFVVMRNMSQKQSPSPGGVTVVQYQGRGCVF
jgi:hypothetical protein